MPTDPNAVAHLLRRITFTGHSSTLAEPSAMSDLDRAELVALVMADAVDRAGDALASGQSIDDGGELVAWWVDVMGQTNSGLHERMVWFWHGHFTSSIDKAGSAAVFTQHLTLRDLALGNFRELAHRMVNDGAMLLYLDSSGTSAANPNENLAREFMELFTVGAGNYTENDVKAGARILAGRSVDWETGEVNTNPDATYTRPVEFRGTRQRWTITQMVDALCDDPHCARHVARCIYRFLVGTDPGQQRLDSLAQQFVASDLEISTLVRAVLNSDEFWASSGRRVRSPIEWLVAARAATGGAGAIEARRIQALGQVPFRPPTVAGWPDDERWLDPGSMLERMRLFVDWLRQGELDEAIVPTVDAVLDRCQLSDVSNSTRQALDSALARQTEFDRGLELLLTIAVTAPEFAVS